MLFVVQFAHVYTRQVSNISKPVLTVTQSNLIDNAMTITAIFGKIRTANKWSDWILLNVKHCGSHTQFESDDELLSLTQPWTAIALYNCGYDEWVFDEIEYWNGNTSSLITLFYENIGPSEICGKNPQEIGDNGLQIFDNYILGQETSARDCSMAVFSTTEPAEFYNDSDPGRPECPCFYKYEKKLEVDLIFATSVTFIVTTFSLIMIILFVKKIFCTRWNYLDPPTKWTKISAVLFVVFVFIGNVFFLAYCIHIFKRCDTKEWNFQIIDEIYLLIIFIAVFFDFLLYPMHLSSRVWHMMQNKVMRVCSDTSFYVVNIIIFLNIGGFFVGLVIVGGTKRDDEEYTAFMELLSIFIFVDLVIHICLLCVLIKALRNYSEIHFRVNNHKTGILNEK